MDKVTYAEFVSLVLHNRPFRMEIVPACAEKDIEKIAGILNSHEIRYDEDIIKALIEVDWGAVGKVTEAFNKFAGYLEVYT